METPKVDTAALDARIREASPAAPNTTPAQVPKTDQQKLVDELGDEGDLLDARIADAEDFIPEGEEGGSDADRQELASQLPSEKNQLEKRIEGAEDAEE